MTEPGPTFSTGKGTLNVVLATAECIVAATDSRRTDDAGTAADDTRKLFLVAKKRALAIAGLCDVSLTGIPGLTAHIPALLEIEIARMEPWADMEWNPPPLPPDIPGEFRGRLRPDYTWWTSLAGPLQTITNIALAYGEPIENLRLVGLYSGFDADGLPRIERLIMMAQAARSSWGKPYVGLARSKDRVPNDKPLIFSTSGVVQLADAVLAGRLPSAFFDYCLRYEGIAGWMRRVENGTTANIPEPEMIGLAQDLIRATAGKSQMVGSSPIQLAVIHPGGEARLRELEFPAVERYLPSQGTWHLGVVFTPEYPFDERKTDVTYTMCEIKGNKVPIPVGDNYFYGNEFENASFFYDGGAVRFGKNQVRSCRLIISGGADESAITTIAGQFSRIEKGQLPGPF